MAHLRIEYSAGLEKQVDLNLVCHKLSDVMAGTKIFPVGGIRVRAFRAEHFSIADKHNENLFCDIVLRMGEGRVEKERQRAGEELMSAAKEIFSELLKSQYFSLSLEVIEINSSFSWKINSIHGRLDLER